MLEKIKIVIVTNFRDRETSETVFRSINPENQLAPRKISLKSFLDKENIVTVVEGNFQKNKELRLPTIVRTVDDYIWSLNIAFDTISTVEEKNEGKGVFES